MKSYGQFNATSLFILCLLSTTVWAQDPIKQAERRAKKDAARLALRYEGERQDLRMASIIINRDNIMSLYRALMSVYLKNEAGKSLQKCNIQTHPDLAIDNITIIYRRNAEWAGPLSKGIKETTSPVFNKLIQDYKLTMEKNVRWDDKHDAITLRSMEPLNMASLGTRFQDISGVVSVDPNTSKNALKTTDIRARRLKEAWEFDFIYYISGRANKMHIWHFRVYDSGKVEFLRESGESLPQWLRCDADKPLASKG